jgi:uncharacterized low-complexity protein
MATKIVKPLTAAVGVALLGSAAVASADALFALKDLGTGYQFVSEGEEGKCGEGKCGEGKCGMDKLDTDKDGAVSRAEWDAAGKPADKWAEIDTNSDGSISTEEASAHHAAKAEEGKCGEGKCGGTV